ncbi:MAG: hypothetical protein MRY49_00610 [Candidatus Pacebacteria bacterium]|nr:hypothetical protein [Candidatus Paceibacterota bacterium]
MAQAYLNQGTLTEMVGVMNDLGPHLQALLDAHTAGTVKDVPVNKFRRILGLSPDAVPFSVTYGEGLSESAKDLWEGVVTGLKWIGPEQWGISDLLGKVFPCVDNRPSFLEPKMKKEGFRRATLVELMAFVRVEELNGMTVVSTGSVGAKKKVNDNNTYFAYYRDGRLHIKSSMGEWKGEYFVLGIKEV